MRMKVIAQEIVRFLDKQHIFMVATSDDKGRLNLVVKGIAKVDPKGIIYLTDLYNGTTRKNLKSNPNMTISVVNEAEFKGWQFRGIAREYNKHESEEILEHWDKKIVNRITNRIIKNMQRGRKLVHFSEAHLPKPSYIIELTVNEIISISGRKLQS